MFPKSSLDVTDGKNHFPIDTPKRARAALAYVNQYTTTPDWYSGDSVQDMVNAVVEAVRLHYPEITISEDAKVAKQK